MSKLQGGIFSNPSGKTAGIVFGAARTRQGKKVTARQLVPPSNPNTAAQQTQRGKFTDSLEIVRYLGTEIYQSDFNRAISQLPGFQSMMSIYMNAMDSSKELSDPPTINLGTLHIPDTLSFAGTGADEITATFSAEVGDNGTVADDIVFFAIQIESGERANILGNKSVAVEARNSGTCVIDELDSGLSYLCGFYLRGSGDAEGNLSVCVWDTVTTS